MRKFILIDHSISGEGGHYLEYASNVLQEAQKTCETYLITNRLYKNSSAPHAGKTFAIYPYDIWGRIPGHKSSWIRPKETMRTMRSELEKVVLCSSLSYFLLGFKSGVFFMTDKLMERFFIVLSAFFLGIVALPFVLLYLAVKVLLRVISGVFLLCNKQLNLPAGMSLKQIFYHITHTIHIKFRGKRKVVNAFYKATRKMLRKVKPQKGDIIFIPTLSLEDTRAVHRILKTIPEAKDCQWILLYRRNLFDGRNPGYRGQLNNKLEWRKVFASFMECDNVRFLTDTEELSDQYQTLGVAHFETVPIPMNPDFQLMGRTAPQQFQIVYAGDARYEKGYQYFPHIAEQFVMHGNTKDVSFRLQSNFSFREVRDDPVVVVSRDSLEAMKQPAIELIKHHVSSEEYLELVRSATVIPLLYDRENYYARSSGALAEALAAGIPVVVPSASWLSLQIMPSIVADQMRLHKKEEQLPVLKTDSTGWYSCADILTAQKIKPKKKSEQYLTAVRSMINIELIQENLKKTKAKAFTTSRLPVMGTQLRPANIYKIPENAKSLFIKFSLDESCEKGAFVRTRARYYDSLGWEISCDEMDHSRLEKLEGLCTTISRIPKEAMFVQLELYCPYNKCFMACLDFTVEFWRDYNFALGGNGCIYVNPERIYDCLTEIQQHLDIYWERAQEAASTWNSFHSSKNLVRMLLNNSGEEAR